MFAQADVAGYPRHVLPADELRANAGELALSPLGGCETKSASATTRPSTASPRNSRRSLSSMVAATSLPASCAEIWASSLANERWVSACVSNTGFVKPCPRAVCNSLRSVSKGCRSFPILHESIRLQVFRSNPRYAEHLQRELGAKTAETAYTNRCSDHCGVGLPS